MNPACFLKENIVIRNLRPEETGIAALWAAAEGWNPGLHDIECHYAVDPDGWFAAEYDGSVIGIVQFSNYDENYSFGGFLAVRPEFRNRGAGDMLLKAGLLHTGKRVCGADGVFEMQETYARKYGFLFAYRNIRFEGEVRGVLNHDFLKAEKIPFEKILEYDTRHFFTQRRTFLEKWINQKESTCLVSLKEDCITGYGMIRRCVAGHKIGPLFADTKEIAEELFLALCGYTGSGPVYLDAPECNESAVLIAKKYNMKEVFGTARMYTVKIPKLPLENIYGVTSFEMG